MYIDFPVLTASQSSFFNRRLSPHILKKLNTPYLEAEPHLKFLARHNWIEKHIECLGVARFNPIVRAANTIH